MSLVIPDELLQIAHINEADLKLEISILLFQQEKITLGIASQFANMNQREFQQILENRTIPMHYDDVENFQQDLCPLDANTLAQAQTHPTQAEIFKRIDQRRTFAPDQHHLPDTLTLLQEDRAR